MGRRATSTQTKSGQASHAQHANGLSDIAIVRAAREIIAEVGVDGLTMRELSARLDVTLGATYHYLPSRDAVIQRVVQDLFDNVEDPPGDTGTWQQQVKAIVLATATAIGQYPGLATYVLAHVDDIGPMKIHDEMAAALAKAGFDERMVHVLMGTLYFYGCGIAATLLSVRQAERFERADVQAMFEDGLDMMLAGAELRLEKGTVPHRGAVHR
jgi:AcrR family transcriptional regulator